MTSKPAPWVHSDDELLRKLSAEGLSASMIADQMPGRTRSAIIGRKHRLKLNDGHMPRLRKKRERNSPVRPSSDFTYRSHLTASGSAHVRALRAAAARLRNADAFKATIEETEVEPLMVHLLDLQEHSCRWPIGDVLDDDFAFCGLERCDGSSYCEAHHRRSRTQARPRIISTPHRRVAA
jgi:GcrA cell cycle regulator